MLNFITTVITSRSFLFLFSIAILRSWGNGNKQPVCCYQLAPHICYYVKKERERETGIVFESVADMTCDDAIAEETIHLQPNVLTIFIIYFYI